MIFQEQIQKNKDRIKAKLEAEKEAKRIRTERNVEDLKVKRTKEIENRREADGRNETAFLIAEKIKGVITAEMKQVVEGIRELKITSPEIPEIILPDIKIPEIKTPDIRIPEIKIPEIKIPKIEAPEIPEIVIPEIILPEIKTPDIDTDKITDAVIEGITEVFKGPLKVLSIDENGDLNKGRIIPGGGAYKWLKNTAGKNINPATEDKQDDIIDELLPVADTPESWEDTSFVTGDSPVTLDINAALGRNATQGTIINDGDGNFTIAFSTNGTDFGDEITLKKDDILNFDKISVDSLRITWVADSAYRVIAI